MNLVLIRYGEISLKSKQTRNRMEKLLVRNIKDMLNKEDIEFEKIIRLRGRIIVFSKKTKNVCNILSRVFGIVSFSPCIRVDANLEMISQTAVELAKEIILDKEKFAVRTRRTGSHDFSSKDVAIKVGTDILKGIKNISVDLENPDKEIFIEIRDEWAYIFNEIFKGPGGLPLGCQGSVVALISDSRSIAASWLMMKRGCLIIPVFFYTGLLDNRKEEVFHFVKKLEAFNSSVDQEVHFVSLEKSSSVILRNVSESVAHILFKRLMFKVASQVCEKYDAKGIVTGEVLNKPLEFYHIVDSITSTPIYRPLIGFDKNEIRRLYGKLSLKEEKTKTYPYETKIGEIQVQINEIRDLEKKFTLDLDSITSYNV